jgi:hypothetical protein
VDIETQFSHFKRKSSLLNKLLNFFSFFASFLSGFSSVEIAKVFMISIYGTQDEVEMNLKKESGV